MHVFNLSIRAIAVSGLQGWCRYYGDDDYDNDYDGAGTRIHRRIALIADTVAALTKISRMNGREISDPETIVPAPLTG